MSGQLKVVVKRITREAADINTFEFVDPSERALPSFTAGAHVDVHLPNGMMRQYSLCNYPRERGRYVVAVLRSAAGRGGSVCMHDAVQEGDELTLSLPRNHFPLQEDAKRHVLIAGGIGITPMLAMARRLSEIGADYTLHYCARSPDKTAFHELLTSAPFIQNTRFHFDNGDPTQGLDLRALLAQVAAGTHVYCCGPTGLVKAVAAASAHWPDNTVHFEFFAVDATAPAGTHQPFEVAIASTGAVYQVAADQTLLQVLLAQGHEIDSSCEEGLCGTCVVEVLDGQPDHRDLVLSTREKQSNGVIVSCCSRAKSQRLTLNL